MSKVQRSHASRQRKRGLHNLEMRELLDSAQNLDRKAYCPSCQHTAYTSKRDHYYRYLVCPACGHRWRVEL